MLGTVRVLRASLVCIPSSEPLEELALKIGWELEVDEEAREWW